MICIGLSEVRTCSKRVIFYVKTENLSLTHYCPYAVLFEKNMSSGHDQGLFCHEETQLTLFLKFYFQKMYLSLMFRNIIQPEGKEKLGKTMCRTEVIL